MREAETRQIFLRQSSFVQVESVGRMLAQLVKSNSPPSGIRAIRAAGGVITADTAEIMKSFLGYYEKLYTAGGLYTPPSVLYTAQKVGMEVETEEFLGRLEIPAITQAERDELEIPISLTEIQQAVADMANQKSPGPDGLPTEIYKYYGELLLPELLKALNGAATGGGGIHPASMLEATIILILKDGKDPLDPASYRPISLLCSDAKIVAKVLAVRLNPPAGIPERDSGWIFYVNIDIPESRSG